MNALGFTQGGKLLLLFRVAWLSSVRHTDLKTHLFYTFLAIFVATSAVTILGVTNVIAVREGYLTALVSAFLIELAGAVIAIFKSANFFDPEKNQLTAEDDIRNSIRKLDAAFGYLDNRLKEQAIHFQSRLLASQLLAPTPRTDIMVLVSQIEKHIGKVHPDVIKEAINIIADVLEAKVHIGSSEKAALTSLCTALPSEFAGESSRMLDILQNRNA